MKTTCLTAKEIREMLNSNHPNVESFTLKIEWAKRPEKELESGAMDEESLLYSSDTSVPEEIFPRYVSSPVDQNSPAFRLGECLQRAEADAKAKACSEGVFEKHKPYNEKGCRIWVHVICKVVRKTVSSFQAAEGATRSGQ